jgi:hypothetical protein
LGEYACKQETQRSMVAIPSKGYVILLVNHSQHNQDLYPEQFDDVLESIARHECLGNIQDGLLFDEGFFVGFYLKKNLC